MPKNSSDPFLSRNIELKARLRDPASAERIAESLSESGVELQSQCDTYFRCSVGRLKLRQINGQTAQLIWYARSDQPQPKASDYRLVEVADGPGLLAALASALGTIAIVRKRRRIYWRRNVRIHLDEVDSLGSFLEFEAVLPASSQPAEEAASRELVEELARQFQLRPDDLLPGSYSDLLLAGGFAPE